MILCIASAVFYYKGLNVLDDIQGTHPITISDPNDLIGDGSEIQNPYTDRHYDGFRWAQQNNMTACDQATLNAIASDSFSEGCQKFIDLQSEEKLNRKS